MSFAGPGYLKTEATSAYRQLSGQAGMGVAKA